MERGLVVLDSQPAEARPAAGDLAAVARSGLHPVELADGCDGLSDDRPGVDSLMWIIPLALYLLSFILAFARVGGGVGPGRHLVASLSHRAARAGHDRRVRSPSMDSSSSACVFRRFAGMPRCAGRRCGRRRGICRRFTSPSPWEDSWAGSGTRWSLLSYSTGSSSIPWRWSWRVWSRPGSRPRDDRRSWKDRLWDLLFAGVVFLLDGDSGDQPGRAGRFGTGRAGRDGRLGPGRSVVRDGSAQADPVCARGRRRCWRPAAWRRA